MSCTTVYAYHREHGASLHAAHEAAASAYGRQHPDEPKGCYWCGERAHRTIECPAPEA